jgi:hypothetical protein
MHFVRPLPNKTSTAIRAALQAIAASFPPAVRIHQVRLDNAHELNALMGAWILDISAKREPTPPYTSEYNGVIERFNREVMTRVRCLLFNAHLPSEWWAEAARYACDVINLTPTQANLDSASPYMLWNGIAPPSRHIRVFGAPGRMRLHAHERHKISEQSVPVRFMSVVDYSLSTYRVYIISQRHVVNTRNVVFNERCASRPPDDRPPPTHICVPLLPDDDDDTPATLSSPILGSDAIANTPADSTETVSTHELPSPDLASPDCPTPMASGAAASVSPPAPSDIGPAGPASHTATAPATATPPECTPTSTQIISSAHGSTTTSSKQIERAAAASAKYGGKTVAVTQSSRNVRQPARLNLLSSLAHEAPTHAAHTMLQLRRMDHALNLAQHTTTVPQTFREVMASDMREQWLAAMRSEINALVMNDIFDLVELPPGQQAISTCWVLKLKALEIFKACFVARGFSQKAGINFDDTYAPVLRLENLRLLLAYAVMNGHVVHSMDVNNAFLQADLHEEIYVTQPEGFVNPDQPHHVYRLKKALYGLKQAPLAWNCTLDTFLVQIGFAAASADLCLYALHNHCASSDGDQGPYDPELHRTFIHSSSSGRPLVILSVYVNNLLIVGSPIDVDAIKKQLCQRFHIKDFGSVSTILGIDIVYNASAGTLDISQQQKILDLATEFELGAKPLSCPLPAGTDLRVVEWTSLTHASLKFRHLVSALLYIALATQPDALHAVVYLS